MIAVQTNIYRLLSMKMDFPDRFFPIRIKNISFLFFIRGKKLFLLQIKVSYFHLPFYTLLRYPFLCETRSASLLEPMSQDQHFVQKGEMFTRMEPASIRVDFLIANLNMCVLQRRYNIKMGREKEEQGKLRNASFLFALSQPCNRFYNKNRFFILRLILLYPGSSPIPLAGRMAKLKISTG